MTARPPYLSATATESGILRLESPRHVKVERQGHPSLDMREIPTESSSDSTTPVLTYHSPTSPHTPRSSRGGLLARFLPGDRRRASWDPSDIELDTTAACAQSDQADKDIIEKGTIPSDSKHLGDADISKDGLDDVRVIDAEAGSSEADILDIVRAQLRRARRRCWMIVGIVFAVLLTTGAIYAAVVESGWNKYMGRSNAKGGMKSAAIAIALIACSIALITKMSTPSSSAELDVQIDGGRGINATALQAVKRIWAHSHNDEMQEHPLATALGQGFGSIEADVWLRNASSDPHLPDEVLWVGHEDKDLRTNQTLWHVYLQPLLDLLDTNNAHLLPNTTVDGVTTVSANATIGDEWVGVYPSDPTASVQLVIDFKNQPTETFETLVRALTRLRSRGYLTTYDQDTKLWKYGPITIIGSGSTPVESVFYQSPRYIFIDAPLTTLTHPFSVPASSLGPAVSSVEWTPEMAPMASSKLPIHFNAGALLPPPPANVVLPQLKWYADQAAAKGIRARWWGAARKPAWMRRRIWGLILDAGNTWINADDLADAREAIGRHAA